MKINNVQQMTNKKVRITFEDDGKYFDLIVSCFKETPDIFHKTRFLNRSVNCDLVQSTYDIKYKLTRHKNLNHKIIKFKKEWYE